MNTKIAFQTHDEAEANEIAAMLQRELQLPTEVAQIKLMGGAMTRYQVNVGFNLESQWNGLGTLQLQMFVKGYKAGKQEIPALAQILMGEK